MRPDAKWGQYLRVCVIKEIVDIMELFVEPGQNYTFLIELILSYLKLEERNKINLIALSPSAIKAVRTNKLNLQVPSLVTAEGEVETEIFQICKRLLEVLPQWKGFFLGEGEAAVEIAGIKTQLKEGKELRKHLQKHLESRTFFVGNHVTFADFYMFTQLYDNLIDMTDEQKTQYHNLFRWYKHIQNLPQVHDYLTKTNRFILTDPAPKLAFLPDKKKPKKEKKEDKKEEKKEDKKEEKKEEKKQEKKEEVEVKSEEKTVA